MAESALGGLIGDDGAELAVYKQVEVGLEDSRGRRFGIGIMFIADLSAECAFFFSRAPSLRGGRSPGGGELIRMKVGDAVARPASRGAWQVAEAWIAEQAGADELVQEYQTAESGVPNGEDEAFASDSDAAEIISQLQARVQELEAQMPQVSRLGAGAPRAPVPPLLQAEPKRRAPGATELFSRAAGAVAPAALEQLKLMAGPPPKRLSHSEEARMVVPDEDAGTHAQGIFAEQQAGAIDDENLAAIMSHSSDPLHQILALQMRQTAALTQKLQAQAPKDSITAALGNDGASSGSNGVKGCIAREAYVKAMEDVVGTGRLMMANAAADMGLGSHQIGSGLMRQYVERRIALADHRLLTYLAQFMACAWQMSHEKGDEFAMGGCLEGSCWSSRFPWIRADANLLGFWVPSRNRTCSRLPWTGRGCQSSPMPAWPLLLG